MQRLRGTLMAGAAGAALIMLVGATAAKATDGATQPDLERSTSSTTGPVEAQESASAAGANEADIVVTANRREQRLQDVPISVTAVSGDSLLRAGVVEPRTLTQVAPSLYFGKSGMYSQPAVRGVGTNSVSSGDEANVAMYIDGIYHPDMATNNFDLLEIERVEILRGPQGTLFGRNSAGGLVNIITRDPQFRTAGSISLGYGRFDAVQARGYVTTPLTDTVAVDLAAQYYDDNGFTRDLVRGGMMADRSSHSFRSRFLFRPSNDVTIRLTGYYGKQSDRTILAAQAWRGNIQAARTQPAIAIVPTSPNESALDIDPEGTARQAGVDFAVEIDLGSIRLNSATSYQDNEMLQVYDSDFSNAFLQYTITNPNTHNISQEIRLSSDGSGPLTWIIGGYAFFNRGNSDISVVTPSATTRILPFYGTDAYAAFADATLTLGRWELTAGTRYSYESRTFRSTVGATVVPLTEVNYDRWTYRGIVQYNFSDTVRAYASVNTGFKSGAFNTHTASAVPVQPEFVTSYELGMKAEPLAGIRASLSVFHYSYTNMQQLIRIGATSQTVNAAKAVGDGAEAEVTAIISPQFRFRLGLSYLDAHYTEFPNAAVFIPIPGGGNSVVARDVAGNQLNRAPRFTGSFSPSYSTGLAGGTLTIGANLYVRSKVYFDFGNRVYQPSYAILNGNISWASPGGLELSVWARNLTNTHYASNFQISAFGDAIFYDSPISFGASARITF